jgi:hypothetical protein
METLGMTQLQLMQMLPLGGKLSRAGRVAGARAAAQAERARDVVWELRGQTAMAFYDLYATDRRLDVERETLRLLREQPLALVEAGLPALGVGGLLAGDGGDRLRLPFGGPPCRRPDLLRVVVGLLMGSFEDAVGLFPGGVEDAPCFASSGVRLGPRGGSVGTSGGSVGTSRGRVVAGLAQLASAGGVDGLGRAGATVGRPSSSLAGAGTREAQRGTLPHHAHDQGEAGRHDDAQDQHGDRQHCLERHGGPLPTGTQTLGALFLSGGTGDRRECRDAPGDGSAA